MAQLQDSAAPAFDVARECTYRFLAAALSDPRRRAEPRGFLRRFAGMLESTVDALRAEYDIDVAELGDGELPPTVLSAAGLAEKLAACEGDLADDYDRVFGLQTVRDCPPYETEFFPNSEPFFRSQQMADIAGFYRAFELQPSNFTRERPDHAALELEFMAFVLFKRRLAVDGNPGDADARNAVEVCDDVLLKFFESHVDWWLPALGRLLEVRDPGGFYGLLGRFLAAFLAGERQWLGIEPSRLNPMPKATDEPEGCEGCTVQIEGLKA